jgi:hypothetical protein
MTTLNGERLTLANVKNLTVVYDSDLVTVERGDIVTTQSTYRAGAFRVRTKGHLEIRGGKYIPPKTRIFYGETAWSDAERFASDVDPKAWGCTRG